MAQPWASQLTYNAKRQGSSSFRASLRLGGVRIVDRSIVWDNTIQGHAYWKAINEDFGRLE